MIVFLLKCMYLIYVPIQMAPRPAMLHIKHLTKNVQELLDGGGRQTSVHIRIADKLCTEVGYLHLC